MRAPVQGTGARMAVQMPDEGRVTLEAMFSFEVLAAVQFNFCRY